MFSLDDVSWPGIVLEDVSGLSSDNISLPRIVLGVVGIVLGRHFLTQNCLGIVGIVLEQHFLHGICSLGKNLKLFTAARVSRPQDTQEAPAAHVTQRIILELLGFEL